MEACRAQSCLGRAQVGNAGARPCPRSIRRCCRVARRRASGRGTRNLDRRGYGARVEQHVFRARRGQRGRRTRLNSGGTASAARPAALARRRRRRPRCDRGAAAGGAVETAVVSAVGAGARREDGKNIGVTTMTSAISASARRVRLSMQVGSQSLGNRVVAARTERMAPGDPTHASQLPRSAP